MPVCKAMKVKEEYSGPFSTQTKLLGHCKPIWALKVYFSTSKNARFHNQNGSAVTEV